MLAEARWLADHGVRELVLVSENSTSYGKDLGDLRLLETLLPELAGRRRHRAGPAVLPAAGRDAARPGRGADRHARRRAVLRHELPALARRRCCAGCAASATPTASSTCSRRSAPATRPRRVRSNVIVGFPGETEADVAELERFLIAARLDAVGVFGYSDEDGTEAETLPDHLPQDVVDERVARLSALVEELTSQRAEERIGELVDGARRRRRATAPSRGARPARPPRSTARRRWSARCDGLQVGDLVAARVVGSEGVDLVAELLERASEPRRRDAGVAVSA